MEAARNPTWPDLSLVASQLCLAVCFACSQFLCAESEAWAYVLHALTELHLAKDLHKSTRSATCHQLLAVWCSLGHISFYDVQAQLYSSMHVAFTLQLNSAPAGNHCCSRFTCEPDPWWSPTTPQCSASCAPTYAKQPSRKTPTPGWHSLTAAAQYRPAVDQHLG